MINDGKGLTSAFLDLSPVAASALGCRCTHRNVTATVVQLGSGGSVVAGRGRQRPVAAVAMPLFQPTGDGMRPMGMYGSSMAMAPAPRNAGGPANPLGARALYLYEGNKDTLYRIHGTNQPEYIGHAISSGCIRMTNEDVIDLVNRVKPARLSSFSRRAGVHP